MSALRRNFFVHLDQELRTVEHTLTYLEAALRGVPCHKTLVAHYEHALADPQAFIEPLSLFLELDQSQREVRGSRPGFFPDGLTLFSAPLQVVRRRLTKNGKVPSRKAHKLTQYAECKRGALSEQECYAQMSGLLESFFAARGFMWPTFAANGFDYAAATTTTTTRR